FQLCRRYAGKLRNVGRRPMLNGAFQQRIPGRMVAYEFLIQFSFSNHEMEQTQYKRQVGSGSRREVNVRRPGGSGAAGINDEQFWRFGSATTIQNPGPEDGLRLSHVMPEEEYRLGQVK